MQTAFPRSTYRRRVEAVLARMEEAGLDVLVTTAPDNVNYLCGYDAIGYLWYQGLILSPRLPEPVFVIRHIEESAVEELSAVARARYYDIAREAPTAAVADVLQGAGLSGARIGIEMQSTWISPAQYLALREALPQGRFIDATTLVAEIRLIKTPEEVDCQRKAAQMADRAMQAALEALRPGLTETELTGLVQLELGRMGSEYPAIPPLVVFGRRTSMVHAMANRVPLAQGDLVMIEVAGCYHRYHAVTMRTAVLGEPPPRVHAAAEALSEAFAAAIGAVQPGRPVGAPDVACDAVLVRHDLARRRAHRIGYSLGLAYPPTWLEAMILDGGDPHRFAPNMSFTMEPNLAFGDEGWGLKLGDTILCTESGAERLSTRPTGLTVVA
ncbi:ectoine hydrolase DoeA [Labrys miyagiensis]